jgi:hypothetical protein
MLTDKMYRYIGRNGNITSDVLLISTEPIPMFRLRASAGKILTNGIKQIYSVIVFEDELKDWTEIDDVGQN